MVLQVLGVADFGIYNLVGGILVLISFLNNSMNAATQRFMNVEKASMLPKRINKIFNISLLNHLLIAFVVLLLAETLGLWFLNNQLNIPLDRMYAANIVYQLSILSTMMDILRVPFNAMILAYERISYYAYVGIFETATKLLIVYLLLAFPDFDHLMFYAVLYMLVNLTTNGVLYVYCRKHFPKESAFRFYKDLDKTKEMLSFSGWSLFGQIAVLGATQGMGMIMNVFQGVLINAALGIANQVNNAVYSFVGNAQVVFNPQIVQSYAAQNREKHINLVLLASRYSFFLFAIISAPLLLATDYLVHLWMDRAVPVYAIEFTKITLLSSVITSLAGPLWMSAYAVGNIKRYQVSISIINGMMLPLTYYMLVLDFSPVTVMLTKLAVDIVLFVYRLFFFKNNLRVEKKRMLSYVGSFLPLLIFLFILVEVFSRHYIAGFFQFVVLSIAAEVLLLVMIVAVGVKKTEFELIKNILRKKYGINNYPKKRIVKS